MSTKSFKGKWKITEMSQWDVKPGWFIEFDTKNRGSLYFICVNAEINYRKDANKKNRVDFTFYGDDEGDEIFGRGWAEMENQVLRGHFYFHQGDDSEFKATMIKSK